jgi:predicted SAM-dependent methyltransferase
MSPTETSSERGQMLDPTPPYLNVREVFADRYLFGEGLEIGPLHQPLAIPAHAHARYVDRMWTDELRREYPELANWDLTEVDVVDDGEKLATIDDESQDFIVANHMLEHTEDPVGTILNHLAKLKPGGVLFYAVPDKRFTFDFRRPVTPIEHMFEDHDEGPERSRAEHFREWCRLVIDHESTAVGTAKQAASPEWVEERAQQLEAQGYSIHMHVWTQAEFLQLLLALREREEEAFDIEIAARTGIEFVVVLRKRGPLPAPAAATAPLTEPPPPAEVPHRNANQRWLDFAREELSRVRTAIGRRRARS